MQSAYAISRTTHDDNGSGQSGWVFRDRGILLCQSYEQQQERAKGLVTCGMILIVLDLIIEAPPCCKGFEFRLGPKKRKTKRKQDMRSLTAGMRLVQNRVEDSAHSEMWHLRHAANRYWVIRICQCGNDKRSSISVSFHLRDDSNTNLLVVSGLLLPWCWKPKTHKT